MVKNLLANAGYTKDADLIPRWGRSLDKEMATHYSILAWKIPWMEDPGGLQFLGLQKVGRNQAHTHVKKEKTGVKIWKSKV